MHTSPLVTHGNHPLCPVQSTPMHLLSMTPVATPLLPTPNCWTHPSQPNPATMHPLDLQAPAVTTFCKISSTHQGSSDVNTSKAPEETKPIDQVSEVVHLRFDNPSDTGSDVETPVPPNWTVYGAPHTQGTPNPLTVSGPPRWDQGTSIAGRVRKRRQSERETTGLPHSFSMESFSHPSLPATPMISTSQSDYSVSTRGKSVQTKTPGSLRKIKRVRRKTPQSSARPRKMKVLASPRSSSSAGQYAQTFERCSQECVQTSEISDLYSCNPVGQTPSLLREVTTEIADRYRYTPSQLAPLSNNQSYLFAVREPDDTEESDEGPSTSWCVITP